MKSRKLSALILALVLALVVLAFAGCGSQEAAEAESKEIVLEVVTSDGETTEYPAETEQEYLQGVMDEIAESSDFTYEEQNGMIMTVNGERADYGKDNAYWAIYVNGAYGDYGMAEQPVTDGDVYRLEYTPAA